MRNHQMRITLQLDDDLLAAARTLARQQRINLGAVISALARQGLLAPPSASSTGASVDGDPSVRNGLTLLPWKPDGAPVDLALVNSLRDELC